MWKAVVSGTSVQTPRSKRVVRRDKNHGNPSSKRGNSNIKTIIINYESSSPSDVYETGSRPEENKKSCACVFVTRQSRQNNDDDRKEGSKRFWKNDRKPLTCAPPLWSVNIKYFALIISFQYSQLFDEHLSSGGTVRRLRANTPTAADRRLSGTLAVCVMVWYCDVSRCTRVCPYSVGYRVTVCACVRALWCGMVRCGAVRCARASSLWYVGETFFSVDCRQPQRQI